jgi:hypothetical protein
MLVFLPHVQTHSRIALRIQEWRPPAAFEDQYSGLTLDNR